jgi:hypothetical protein
MKTIELWFGKWDSPSIFFIISPIIWHEAKRPISKVGTCSTSEQAAYRLLRLFQKSERAHCAAPPFQIGPASLGSDLVLGAGLIAASFLSMKDTRKALCRKGYPA